MPALGGATVAVLETRMSRELSELIRRLGGVPYVAPAVREVPHFENIPPFLDALTAGQFSIVIFQTGVGVNVLLREAERLGRLDETLAALRTTTVACRGPKPTAVLKRNVVPVHLKAAEPYTTTELLDAFSSLQIDGLRVGLIHYGEVNHVLADALRQRGARLDEYVLYEWRLPEDFTPLTALVRDLINQQVDVIAFTSQVQCRHLFDVARADGRGEDLARALSEHTIVGAVGPVCAAALRAHHVIPDVLPAHPTMGALIAALADYVELLRESDNPL
jgi:uroporphyrinogen-III synthase